MMTDRELMQQALEALEAGPDVDPIFAGETEAALRARLAEPELKTCNCRWDGETQVQQCTLHEAHVDAIHEWAERAKAAEKKLSVLTEPETCKPALQVERADARRPLTDEEILKAVGWETAEMYFKLTPGFPVAEARAETLKNARAIERAHGITGGNDD